MAGELQIAPCHISIMPIVPTVVSPSLIDRISPPLQVAIATQDP